jgi:anti-sigma factor RsiW
MTLLAGTYALGGNGLDAAAVESIHSTLGQAVRQVETYHDGRLFLAKSDIGAFRSAGLATGSGVAAVTGDPLLERASGVTRERIDAVAEVLDRDTAGSLDWLLRCRGSFSLARYNPGTPELLLATDRAGVRALYYHVGAQALYFASNLRILERIAAITRSADLQAIAEIAVLGFPLGNRTAYRQIEVLRGGQYLLAGRDGVELRSYWEWRDAVQPKHSRGEYLPRLHDEFLAALACRSATGPDTRAFLSGGLDSRVVVAGLKELGKQVHALTFTREGLMDGALASRFADAIGVDCIVHSAQPGDAQRTLKSNSAGLTTLTDESGTRRPDLIFSGDGGSVGVGYVYMDEPLVAALRGGRVDDAVSMHLGSKRKLPTAVLANGLGAYLDGALRRSIRHELERARTGDPAKDFHVYLMDNDQRRHLHYHYEQIDESRTEFLLPFFDARFLELAAQGPVDWFLLHDLYNEWLHCFAPATYSTPWQAYPGHRPSEVPVDLPELRNQWRTRSRSQRFSDSDPAFRATLRSLLTGRLPRNIFDTGRVTWAALLHGLRIRDLSSTWIASVRMLDTLSRTEGCEIPADYAGNP